MPLSYTIGDGADALLYNQLAAGLDGTYWSSGVDASPGANALEVDLTSGTVYVQTASVSVSGQTVTLAAADADPRKDVIYIDDAGDAQVLTGVAAAPLPEGEVRSDTYVPEPPSMDGVTGVAVAEVWVPGGASDITSSDIRDRRLSNDAINSAVQNPLTGDLDADGNDITNIGHGSADSFDIAGRPVTGGIPETDKATSFDGANGETVSTTDATVKNNAILLAGVEDSWQPGSFQSTFATPDFPYGYRINPNTDIATLEITTSTNCTADTVYLETEDGTLSTSGVTAGDTVTFSDVNMLEGTTYRVYADSGANQYDAAYDAGISFPISGEAFDVVAGDYNGSSSDYGGNIAEIHSVAKLSGSATVEWSHPAENHAWTTATFQRTLDNETVEIYVEYGDGSGWTTANGGSPISRGFDLSSIAASSEVRFRVELSRQDPNNNPTCDLLARQYIL